MAQQSSLKLKDLIPDNRNFNIGTEAGAELIKKSFSKFGAGRSILIDKNNKIIAGNKSVENATALGMDDLQIVESDGKRIIAVKRMDIDLDTPEGREMALADNSTAKANIVWAEDVIAEEIGIEMAESWGVELKAASPADPFNDEGINGQNKYGVIVMCESEAEREQIFSRLTGEGFTCKVVVV